MTADAATRPRDPAVFLTACAGGEQGSCPCGHLGGWLKWSVVTLSPWGWGAGFFEKVAPLSLSRVSSLEATRRKIRFLSSVTVPAALLRKGEAARRDSSTKAARYYTTQPFAAARHLASCWQRSNLLHNITCNAVCQHFFKQNRQKVNPYDNKPLPNRYESCYNKLHERPRNPQRLPTIL